MNREERTHEYYERVLLHTDCKTSKGKPIKPIEYFVKVIPDGATNGGVIQAMFPNTKSRLDERTGIMLVKWTDGTTKTFKASWWYAPYKRGEK